MTTHHTPTPWNIRQTDKGLSIQFSDGENYSKIAELYDSALCEEHGDLLANALLIASAPDMFDALQAIIDAFGDQDSLLIDQCKAALNKAKVEAK